ncbi:50S ribosomal protein L1 [Candidatus Gottesmanbacteria bacterium]|nr:50S ribosomal protein L1 [Candidatus Gottesmanbacteria bacterium]
MEGVELKPEIKRLVEEVESGETPDEGKRKKEKGKKAKPKSKRYQEAAKLVDRNKQYALTDAIDLVKKTSLTKFDGTVELHINLNHESIGETKAFRASVRLPHATGKTVRVAIADDELLLKIEKGQLDFDVLVAPPSMMPKLAKFAKMLGPKGLMPNPKNGTVTDNPEKRAKELAGGEVNFKTDPDQPLLHLVVGKVSQPEKELAENIEAYLSAIGKPKILKVTLSSTMGPGIKVALS